jgi:transcriptional regulator with XRE-family HTH domain
LLTLVPPRRLGALLHTARGRRSSSLAEVAQRTRLSVAELEQIERGERPLGDDETSEVLRAYGVEPGDVLPERTELVIDLGENVLVAGGEVRTLAGDAPTADAVLASYLSLVYTLRSTAPGTPIVLRDADVAVLSTALHLARTEVEFRLHELMDEPDGEVARRMGLLHHRLLFPVAGVVVAATTVGALLLVQSPRDQEVPSTPPVTSGAPTTAPTVGDPAPPGPGTIDPETEVGPAVVQDRDSQVVTGNEIPLDQIPDVGLAPPQVATPGPDGAVTQQTLVPDDTAGAGPGG